MTFNGAGEVVQKIVEVVVNVCCNLNSRETLNGVASRVDSERKIGKKFRRREEKGEEGLGGFSSRTSRQRSGRVRQRWP